MSLAEKTLNQCTRSSTPVSITEISLLLNGLNGWRLISENNTNMICRGFEFKNYSSAQAFANKIADLAEQENHHPRVCIEWGKVNVTWWTHCINGLFINDFIMAARCDNLFTELKTDS